MCGWPTTSPFAQHLFYISVNELSSRLLQRAFFSVAVSFDRYMAIENPLKYKQKMTKRTIFILIGCIWLISVLLSYGPVLLGVYSQSRAGSVSPDPTACGMRPNLIYSIISSSTSFYIPLIIILFLYGRIFITARKHSHELQKLENIIKRLHSNEKFVLESAKWNKNIKAIRTLGQSSSSSSSYDWIFLSLGIVVGVFVACWLPFFVMYLLLAYCNYECVNPNVERYITWIGRRQSVCQSETRFGSCLGYANSFCNPVIYAFSNK
jgi:adrenergic receptor beta-3